MRIPDLSRVQAPTLEAVKLLSNTFLRLIPEPVHVCLDQSRNTQDETILRTKVDLALPLPHFP